MGGPACAAGPAACAATGPDLCCPNYFLCPTKLWSTKLWKPNDWKLHWRRIWRIWRLLSIDPASEASSCRVRRRPLVTSSIEHLGSGKGAAEQSILVFFPRLDW